MIKYKKAVKGQCFKLETYDFNSFYIPNGYYPPFAVWEVRGMTSSVWNDIEHTATYWLRGINAPWSHNKESRPCPFSSTPFQHYSTRLASAFFTFHCEKMLVLFWYLLGSRFQVSWAQSKTASDWPLETEGRPKRDFQFKNRAITALYSSSRCSSLSSCSVCGKNPQTDQQSSPSSQCPPLCMLRIKRCLSSFTQLMTWALTSNDGSGSRVQLELCRGEPFFFFFSSQFFSCYYTRGHRFCWLIYQLQPSPDVI